jgi:hypothetical protein
MSNTLYAITNAKLPSNHGEKYYNAILNKLINLNWDTTSINLPSGPKKEYGEWSYYIENEVDMPYSLCYHGPFSITFEMMSSICVLHTIYKFWLIYENYKLNWFDSFRKQLFDCISILGGTEIIFLPDQRPDRLCYYWYEAIENVPYEIIKSRMIKEFGYPITDYKLLNLEQLSHSTGSEFFIDDFSDLRTKDKA